MSADLPAESPQRSLRRRLAHLPWTRAGAVRVVVPVVAVLALVQARLPATMIAPQLRALEATDGPVALLFGTVVGIAAAFGVVEPSDAVWRMAVPTRRLAGQLRVVMLVGLYLGIIAVGAPGQVAASAVVVLTATSEALLSTVVVGYRMAWVVPGLHAALSGLLGARLFGDLAWWAWPARPDPSVGSVVLGVVALLVGLVVVRLRGTAGSLPRLG